MKFCVYIYILLLYLYLYSLWEFLQIVEILRCPVTGCMRRYLNHRKHRKHDAKSAIAANSSVVVVVGIGAHAQSHLRQDNNC